jgi:hypothetical protein
MSGLHPRIAEIIDVLEHAHRDLVEVVTAIPEARRGVPGADGRWSVAQHLEHLAMVEDGAGRVMSKLIKEVAARDERETESSSLLGSLDRFQVWTSATRKIVAPELVQPREGLTADEALARLTTARTRMIGALQKASGLALASVTFPHPVVGPLNVYQWGLMAAQHERRHLEQIRAVAGLDDA